MNNNIEQQTPTVDTGKLVPSVMYPGNPYLEALAKANKVVADIPPPSKSPTSDRFIADLEEHYAIETDPFKGFGKMPKELAKMNGYGLTKPSTRAALLLDVQLLDPEKLATLKKLAVEHTQAITEQCKWTPVTAKRDFEAQRAKLHAIATDRGATMPDGQFRTRESFQQEYADKNRAITERLKLIVVEAHPLCLEAIRSVENHLKDMLRALEEGERETAAGFDLTWEPSQLWHAAARNLLVARNDIRHFTGRPDQGPSHLLSGFINLN